MNYNIIFHPPQKYYIQNIKKYFYIGKLQNCLTDS